MGSGAIAYEEAIKEFDQLVKHATDKGETQRPIVMRIQYGPTTPEMKFETTQAAWDYLKERKETAEEGIKVAQAHHDEAKAHVTDAGLKLDEAKMAHENAETIAKDAGAYDIQWN